MDNNEQLCPLCGCWNKECLVMPIKQAVDLPNEEHSAYLERVLKFFQADSMSSMVSSQSFLADINQKVCIACVHLLSSCVHFYSRKLKSGILKKTRIEPTLQSPPEPSQTKNRTSFELLMEEEVENASVPVIFLDSLLHSSHSFAPSPFKFKTMSTLHSDDLKRILSDRVVTEPEVSDGTSELPKQPEKVDVSQNSSIVNNIDSPSSINKCGQNAKLLTKNESNSDNLPMSRIEEKTEEVRCKTAEDQPVLSPETGLKKQEIFMYGLNLCKPSDSFPSSSRYLHKIPVESRSAMQNNLSVQDDSTPDEQLSIKIATRSSSDEPPQIVIPNSSPLTTSRRSSPRLGPSSSSVSKRNILQSRSQELSARRDLSSIFFDNNTEIETNPSDSNLNPSNSGLTLRERVNNIRRKTVPAPKPNKFFKFSYKGTSEEKSDKEYISSSINSGKSLLSSSVIAIRTENDGSQSNVHKIMPSLQKQQQQQEMDFTLKPFSLKQNLTKNGIPNSSANFSDFSKILSATTGLMEDVQNVKSSNHENTQQISKCSLQSSVETEMVTNDVSSLKSILKKPKTFMFGAEKSVLKKVKFDSESSIRYFQKDIKSHSDYNAGEEVQCDSNTSSQNFRATISLESDTSSVEFNISSEKFNSNISFNVATKSQKELDQRSAKQLKLMNKDMSNVNEESNCSNLEHEMMTHNNLNVTPVKQISNIKSHKLSNTKGTPDLKEYKHQSKLKLPSNELSVENISDDCNKCTSVPTNNNENTQTTDVKKLLFKDNSMLLKTCNTKPSSFKKNSETFEQNKNKRFDDQMMTTRVSDLKYSTNFSSEKFLRGIGLIDDLDNLHATCETSSCMSNVVNYTDDLKPIIETDSINLVQSKDISSSCDSDLNIVSELVVSTPEIPVKKHKGRSPKRAQVLCTETIIKKVRLQRKTLKSANKNDNSNSNSNNSLETEGNKAKEQKVVAANKPWKAKYLADKVVENKQQIPVTELLSAQRQMLSCYVLLYRCDTISKELKNKHRNLAIRSINSPKANGKKIYKSNRPCPKQKKQPK